MFTQNRFELIGHVGKDVKVTKTDDKKFVRFSLATDASYKKDDGTKVEASDWHQLVCFRPKTVELIEKHISKGQYIRVEGVIKPRTYEKDGEKQYVIDLNVSSIGFLSPKPSE